MRKPKANTPKLGIWDADLRGNVKSPTPNSDGKKVATDKTPKRVKGVSLPSHTSTTVAELRKTQKPRKRWGISNLIWSGVAFLAVQVLVSVAILAYITATTPLEELTDSNGNVSTDSVMNLFSNPLILILSQASLYAVWLGFAWFATTFQGAKSWARDFWLKFRWYDAPLGLAIAIGLVFAQLFLLWAIPALFPNLDMSGTDNASVLTSQTGIWFPIIAIGIVGIVGPICEEIYFRGFLMQGLIRYFRKGYKVAPTTLVGDSIYQAAPSLFLGYLMVKRWLARHKYVLAVIISSVLFGLMHFQGVESFGQILVPIVTGLIGLLLAVVAIKTRRIGLGIFIHIFFNTTGVILSTFS